jgi:choline dehydrogenase-like flavoprotein
MFIDARALTEGQVVHATVCIIGAGPSGLTLALELGRQGIDVLVLESGGLQPDPETTSLLRGEVRGLDYEFGIGYRSRFFGGGSNCWGGFCRPLEENAFQVRSWIPYSGWPFGREELLPYYRRAHQVLQLGPFEYDAERWVAAIDRPFVRRMPLSGGDVVDGACQFSRPTRFGTVYHDEIKSSRHIRVHFYANVVEVRTSGDGQAADEARCRTLTGRQFTARAQVFVLAAGGIDNPRLLLASNRQHPAGLGNANDLVGRFFMDHPRLSRHQLSIEPQWRSNHFYDNLMHFHNPAISAHGVAVAGALRLTPEAQAREGLLDTCVWFRSMLEGEQTLAGDALLRMKMRMHGRVDEERHSKWQDLATIARHPRVSARYVAARMAHTRGLSKLRARLVSRTALQMICEPTPNPDSRVTLSGERDAIGLPKACVDWRPGELVKRTLDRVSCIMADELRRIGVAEVTLDEPLEGRPWPGRLSGAWHHMGTTRMHDSPRQGVVDRHCRVHGMHNFFIAGSSVFPTAGANFPTFTLTALSLRLADRLVNELKGRPLIEPKTAGPRAGEPSEAGVISPAVARAGLGLAGS